MINNSFKSALFYIQVSVFINIHQLNTVEHPQILKGLRQQSNQKGLKEALRRHTVWFF